MPAWTVSRDAWTLKFPLPIGFSMPKVVDESWGKYYAADATTNAFWGLYTNRNRVQDYFVKYWKRLATLFKDEVNILGYELLNEPFICSRSTVGVPFGLMNRAKTEKQFLAPLYDRLATAIRTIDTRSLIFYEPATGGGGNSGEGFTQPPNNDVKKSVMAFHSCAHTFPSPSVISSSH
jgi:endoglycosylceramidase